MLNIYKKFEIIYFTANDEEMTDILSNYSRTIKWNYGIYDISPYPKKLTRKIECKSTEDIFKKLCEDLKYVNFDVVITY